MQKYADIANYIDAISLGVLGTIDDDGTPHGAVVYVCTDEKQSIVYFVTKTGTRKYKNLVARPAVSLTMLDGEDNSTLQAKDQARVERDAAILDKVIIRIVRAHTRSIDLLPPISKLRAGDYVTVAIEITEARLGRFKGKSIGDPGIFTEA